MSLPHITVTGTLVGDPELKFVGTDGVAVSKFTVASNDRKFNRETKQWENGESTFLDCTAWKQLAEGIAENLTKGSRVVLTGKLKQESWEKDGQKRSKLKVDVEDIGASLLFAQKKPANVKADDPWGSAPGGW